MGLKINEEINLSYTENQLVQVCTKGTNQTLLGGPCVARGAARGFNFGKPVRYFAGVTGVEPDTTFSNSPLSCPFPAISWVLYGSLAILSHWISSLGGAVAVTHQGS